MNSPNSNSSVSKSFERLDRRIQGWIWSKGWTTLREAQELAIEPILSGATDVVIASATASGKTEAAFLPILTKLVENDAATGCVIYISPLKALINDQWDRLIDLCGELETPVVPWHGDIAQGKKTAFIKKPAGVVLITPESLESLFVNKGAFVAALAQRVRYIVVDELHAFIGSERGKQLQSLLARLEVLAPAAIPRIGLSATLGDMPLAAKFLRPGGCFPCEIIQGGAARQSLKILVKGVLQASPKVERKKQDGNTALEDMLDGGIIDIAGHLFKTLRGSNNLVFPGSRNLVELYADLLRRQCEREGMPNEFWPHHGNLSKSMREETEAALKQSDRPATAICTTTLEMGIDIGAIKCVSQVGPPSSVASLRQRLGRSGRRAGESAILRGYCLEAPPEQAKSLSDRLREGLVQTVAVIELLVVNWFEPPRSNGVHASTLVQQILSAIAERGGIHARELWSILIERGAFPNVTKAEFELLLRELGERDFIVQDPSGILLHGEVGERVVNQYEFYSAFVSDDEYRIIAEGKALGTMPLLTPIKTGSALIFAGRRWRVAEIDEKGKAIYVRPDRGGAPPLFSSGGAIVHDRIRQKMFEVLESAAEIVYLDKQGGELLGEARRTFRELDLSRKRIVADGSSTMLLTWRGDAVNETIRLIAEELGTSAINEGIGVRLFAGPERITELVKQLAEYCEINRELNLNDTKNLAHQKWDWVLPVQLLRRSFSAACLDIDGARTLLRTVNANLAARA